MSQINTKKLSLFNFLMLTGSMIVAIYGYPAFASSGLSLIFFLLFAGACYFIPTALVSAELATGEGWEEGGVYHWCSVAFGKRWGFAAIFFQWLQISVGFVTMLYFIVGTCSYLLHWPALNINPFLKFSGVMVIFWFITVINLYGTSFTAKISTIGLILGSCLPVLILIVLSLCFIYEGNHLLVDLHNP